MTAVIRRQYLGGAAATLGGLLAAACGEPEVKYVEKIVEKIVEKPAPAAEPKTVIFDTDWLEGVRGDIINQSLEEWAGLHPQVTIDKRNIQNPEGGIVPKVTTLMAADDMGDLMLWAGFFFTYWAKRGIFADISPYLKQFKLSLDDYFYIPEHVIYEGRTYGWPFQGGPKDFMYNKSLFQKHGVPEPDDTWTWDTLVEVGKKLTSPEENVYALWDHRWYTVETLMYAIGDGPRTKDNTQWVLDGPVGVEAITFLHDLIFRHQIVPSRQLSREKKLSQKKGNFAIWYHKANRDFSKQVDFEWDVMRAPIWKATGRRAVHQNSQPHVITKWAGQHGVIEETALLAAHLAGPFTQRLAAEGNTVPVLKQAMDTDTWLDSKKWKRHLVIEGYEHRFGNQGQEFWWPSSGAWAAMLNRVWTGEVPPLDGAREANRLANLAIELGTLTPPKGFLKPGI